jgi:hypothetical protein
LLLVSIAAIFAFLIATLPGLITESPRRGELEQVAPVELGGGQGARGGHEGSEPDRRDGKRPQGHAEVAEPDRRASESQAAGSTAEPTQAPAFAVAVPSPPNSGHSSGGGAASPAPDPAPGPAPDPPSGPAPDPPSGPAPGPAPDPAGEPTVAPPTTPASVDDVDLDGPDDPVE